LENYLKIGETTTATTAAAAAATAAAAAATAAAVSYAFLISRSWYKEAEKEKSGLSKKC
jgi:hypothetical protein